jgi:hypothetical protein
VAVVDREADHSRELARKRTARPPRVVARSREAGHSREAEHKEAAYNQVVSLRTRVRVATCKRRAAAHSRAVADRIAEVRRKRAAVYKPAAAAHNHAALQKRTAMGYSRVPVDRNREGTHNRAASRLALQRDPPMRPRRGVLPKWQSQCKGAASVLSSVSPADLNTELGRGVPLTEGAVAHQFTNGAVTPGLWQCRECLVGRRAPVPVTAVARRSLREERGVVLFRASNCLVRISGRPVTRSVAVSLDPQRGPIPIRAILV